MKRKEREISGNLLAKKVKKFKRSANDVDTYDTNIQTKNNVKAKIENKNSNYEKFNVNNAKVEKKVFNKVHVNRLKNEQKKSLAVCKNGSSTEKPDWIEIKKGHKELRKKRRENKLTDIYSMSIKSKQIGEKLRRLDCKPNERNELTGKLHALMEGNYDKIIFRHDMSRIVQWLFKYCCPEIKQKVLDELKPHILTVFQSKYAKNCINVMLKHGSSKIRQDILIACYGNVINLLSNNISTSLIEFAYSNYATKIIKVHYKQEFYGDMYKSQKDDNILSLSDVFKATADMKSATLTAVKRNLIRVLNKHLIQSSLVQLVLWEFLSVCSSEDKEEILVMLRSSIVELSKSKIGAKIGAMCVWTGTNKDRKSIMKSLKDNLKDLATSEYGYIVLLSIFDCVDDTVMIGKIILAEILKELIEIALDEHGKHVLLYLVARRNPQYFPPSIVKFLKQGDNNASSKKAADVRERELKESVIEVLLKSIAKETSTWLQNSSIAMVALAILKAGTGATLKEAFLSIIKFITDESSLITTELPHCHPIEHSGLHVMLKKLIQNDKQLIVNNEIQFGDLLIEALNTKILEKWTECNRSCFILILLLENESDLIVKSLTSKLKPFVTSLEMKSGSGALILLKKLKAI
ncbi:pumilio homolog 3-like [Prorops nasuta]|uniref:pumilio homolog 3-like n=1 Tax=Prorops nasuta TaxID=863751 RepID=UPI0034CF9D82